MRKDMLLTVLLLVVSLASLSCAAKTHPINAGMPDSALRTQLEELAALEMPGVAPETAKQIKAAFAEVLRKQKTNRTTSDGKFPVSDLAITDNGDGTATLRWSYLHPGDLDQNGECNINDLTTLGVHLGKTTLSGDWMAAEPADADGNGEVNLSDLSVLGAHLGHKFHTYRVWYETDPISVEDAVVHLGWGAGYADLADSLLPSGGGRRTFEHLVSAEDYASIWYYWVDAIGWHRELHWPSNFVTVNGDG